MFQNIARYRGYTADFDKREVRSLALKATFRGYSKSDFTNSAVLEFHRFILNKDAVLNRNLRSPTCSDQAIVKIHYLNT
ncbi:hypothetical protein [Nostoc sp. CCY 9925]|uniref:hypothetical protein n=1 Tax=Nostoc sp. CCY 9925 TaxID=3103865 RepID=UPI0039C6E5E4